LEGTTKRIEGTVMSILLIENFLRQPDKVRELALQQEYFTAQQFTEKYKSHTDWPGQRTEHVVDLHKEYADAVLTQLAHIANVNFGLKNVSIRSYFHVTTVNDGDSWVHQDNNIDLAAILYLTPNAPLSSGTSFYRCNDVKKWESYMASQEGYQTLKQINREERKDLYNELFTPHAIINNIYNQLVVYYGTEYHKSNDYFGDSIEDGRLTQVFFITSEK
jgi:hypothetical protein